MRRELPARIQAWSRLEIKAVDDSVPGKRIFSGIASTPSTDRMGDEVMPLGALFKLPIPFLWQHDSELPIGQITEAKVTKNGIEVVGYVENLSDPPSLKDDLDRAWAMIKAKLVRGLSIGFKPIKTEPIDEDDDWWGPLRYLIWEWLELSAVTIPANADASIQTIKSYDQKQGLAALGNDAFAGVVRLKNVPGASGQTQQVPLTSKGSGMKQTIAEQMAAFEAKRQAAVARMSAIMEEAGEAGATLAKDKAEEYDNLKNDISTIDKHLTRLRDHEKVVAATLAPVESTQQGAGGATREENKGGQAKSGEDFIIKANPALPKGMAFTRFVMCIAAAKGDSMRALERAKQFKDTPEVEIAVKAAVAAGTSTDATWAGPLVQLMPMASEFVEFLYPLTILGRVVGFRRVPFNIKVPRQTAGAAASKWVGQGSPKPLSKLSFDTISLGFAKISTIVVLTEELVRFSSPAAEALCRQDLAEAIAKYMDGQFINPDVAAVANVSPASVTNGATKINATGTTLDSVTTDVASVFAEFTNNNVPLTGAVWVMNPRTSMALGMIRNAMGGFAFPTIDVNGGTFFGLPVVASQNVPISAVSANETFAVLMKPSEILLADDGAITVDLSNEASLEMSDAPVGGATTLVSLWQNNLIGLRAERFVNWLPRRAHAVAVWDGLRL